MEIAKQVSSSNSFRQHLCPAVAKLADIVVSHGRGSYVWSEDGDKYLDLSCGIGVTSTGHCHPKIVAALQDQAAQVIHAQQSVFAASKPMVSLIDRLNRIVPSHLDSYFFCTSGAEAVENAVKVARGSTGRQNMIVFENSFHGRTLGAMSMTASKSVYRAGFGPFMPGVVISQYPYCLHCQTRQQRDGYVYKRVEAYTSAFQDTYNQTCCGSPLQTLKNILQQQSTPSETAGIIIEPIMGEGGFLVPPQGFLQTVQQICKEHGILFIIDEVQSGVGRTGKWWGFQNFDMDNQLIEPDLLIFAKGIASGFPFAGLAGRKDLFDKLSVGSLGGTYGSNPVGCAVAATTLDVIQEENMLQNANKMGLKLIQGLYKIAQEHDCIADVRGRGLMVAVEFQGQKGLASLVSKQALKRGVVILTAGSKEVIRFLPPLNIVEEDIQIALEVFHLALKDALEMQLSQQ